MFKKSLQIAPENLAVMMGIVVFVFTTLGAGSVGAQKASPSKGKGAEPDKSPPPPKIRLSDRLLQEIEAKRREQSQRKADIRREESRLNELRADIKKRIATLKNLEKQVQKVLDKVESANDERLTHLVKAYSAMGPDEAAKLINAMNIVLAVRILRNMKVKKAGTILAVVEPRRAAQISEMLVRAKARKKKK